MCAAAMGGDVAHAAAMHMAMLCGYEGGNIAHAAARCVTMGHARLRWGGDVAHAAAMCMAVTAASV
jgi:hypothetical protein